MAECFHLTLEPCGIKAKSTISAFEDWDVNLNWRGKLCRA